MELTASNLIKWFQIKYPKIVKAMQGSQHHYSDTELNPYHLEGDVWTHTCMVLLKAHDNCINDPMLDKHLLVSALLHDIGKPMMRRNNDEKKRVHFYSHEPMSAFLALPIINEIEEDFGVDLNKRLLVEVISMHTEVFKLTEEKLKERLVNNRILARLLTRLSKSDHEGRFYEMGDRITDVIVPPRTIVEEKDKNVICLVGLPCSGKSTMIDKTILTSKSGILSRDSIVEELGKEMGFNTYEEAFNGVDQKEVDKRFNKKRSELIKTCDIVYIDMTNMSRKSRRKNMQGFKGWGKTAYVMMTDLETIAERNEQREGKTIPDHVYKRMISAFQPPLFDEFDDVYWEFN